MMPMFMFFCHNVNGCSIAGMFRCWGSRFIGEPPCGPTFVGSSRFPTKEFGDCDILIWEVFRVQLTSTHVPRCVFLKLKLRTMN